MIIEKLMVFLDRTYHQKRIINFLKNKNIKLLIDVGAHKGEFINCGLQIKSIEKIIAFEPQKKIFELLKKKFIHNNKVNLNNTALDIENSKKKIKINKLSSTSTLNERKRNSLYYKFKSFLLYEKDDIISEYEIKTISFDNFFKSINLDPNTLLKIDTEGYEFNVLQGAREKIENVKYVLIENQFSKMYKNVDFEECDKFLKNKNFKLLKKFKFPTLHYEDRLYLNTLL